jgi:Sensory domain found in PocR
VLDAYGKCVGVAVTLLDHGGVVIGKVHNPMPIWNLARAARPDWLGCPFAGHCIGSAEVEQTRSLVVVRGMGGLVHTAIPVFLRNQHLGTLIAETSFRPIPGVDLVGASCQRVWSFRAEALAVGTTATSSESNDSEDSWGALLQTARADLVG